MVGRELPEQLRAALTAAESVIMVAGSRRQRREALRAAGLLYAAARHQGWMTQELADGIGISRQTVGVRCGQALAMTPGLDRSPGAGLHIPAAPRPVPAPPSGKQRRRMLLRRPADERDVLTAAEAATHLGVSIRTLSSWLEHGLLPDTDRTVRTQFLYTRPDLDRLRRLWPKGGGRYSLRDIARSIDRDRDDHSSHGPA